MRDSGSTGGIVWPPAGVAWRPAPHAPVLGGEAVQVWLTRPLALDASIEQLLCPQEHERAARFARALAGTRWARARGLLRHLLGLYLGRDPRTLCFTAGPHGKPELAGAGVSFNLSHSGELALYAFSAAGPVGVDVEVGFESRRLDEVALARRALGEAEAKRLAALEPAARRDAFLKAWVRHEARVKCAGTGLGSGRADLRGGALWLAELEMASGQAAAVAVRGQPRELRCWSLTGSTPAACGPALACA